MEKRSTDKRRALCGKRTTVWGEQIPVLKLELAANIVRVRIFSVSQIPTTKKSLRVQIVFSSGVSATEQRGIAGQDSVFAALASMNLKMVGARVGERIHMIVRERA